MRVALGILSAMLACIAVAFNPFFKLRLLLICCCHNILVLIFFVNELHVSQFVFCWDIQQCVTFAIVAIKRFVLAVTHRQAITLSARSVVSKPNMCLPASISIAFAVIIGRNNKAMGYVEHRSCQYRFVRVYTIIKAPV